MSITDEQRTGDGHGVVESLRAAVMAAGELWSTGQCRLVRLVAELEASGEWAFDGSPTCAHWIAAALDVEQCTAREWLRIGRALAELEVIDRAFEQGRLSYSKVRALTRVATVANQAELCELAERVPAGRLPHALAAWLTRHETAAETRARHHAARSLTFRLDVDGMIVGSFRLPPEIAAGIIGSVNAIVMRNRPSGRRADAPADASVWTGPRWPTVAQQRADALVELVGGGGASITTEVVLHVRADGCSLDDGTPIAGSVVERIAPEAFIRALIYDAERRPINASARQRHPTTRQRRVVHARDRVCVDCGSTEFLHYDHEPDYEQSRRTVVKEIRLRCWICHRKRHREQQERL